MSESVSIYKLGITGKAYDMPGTCRAYTYQHQPDNLGAWRLGEAMSIASKASGGDYIDTGLGLLQQLELKGFGVYELDAAKSLEKPKGPGCTCGLPCSPNPHPEAGKPGRYLEVGTQHECIPCTVKSRHEWAQRATKAENRLRELAEQTDAVPEETPHIIVFDDADRPNEMFSGAGARPAALRRWQQISVSWNAHMFVCVERNSRDDTYPCAKLATQANRIPAGLYAELEALRTLRDATRVYRDSYMRDQIEDEDSCVSTDQHDAACSVQAALESAQALEWKGGNGD